MLIFPKGISTILKALCKIWTRIAQSESTSYDDNRYANVSPDHRWLFD